LERKGTLFLLALPLAAVELILNPATIGRRDFGGWSPFIYIIFFIYGYVILSHYQLQGIVKKTKKNHIGRRIDHHDHSTRDTYIKRVSRIWHCLFFIDDNCPRLQFLVLASGSDWIRASLWQFQ